MYRGEILSLEPNAIGMMMGKVSFGGVAKEVCLAYVPEAQMGDYVIVHAGFALNTMNEEEANEVFELLQQMGEIDEGPTTNDEVTMFVVRHSSFVKGNPCVSWMSTGTKPMPVSCSSAIERTVTRPWTIMEICGGQTHTLIKSGSTGCCRRRSRWCTAPAVRCALPRLK